MGNVVGRAGPVEPFARPVVLALIRMSITLNVCKYGISVEVSETMLDILEMPD
jgi:hypothetical protein